ncbi:MAG: endonuclease/exonuclease/phosphatase family protein [Deltaproteobacteria bacterium]|nr:endonuclease/exonuclease/phosphatase family protein [Deltaproteobacteria bacterium]
MRIRLISWNIHKGIGGIDRRYRLERIIEILRGYAPDVALLQEVAQFMPRSHFHDQAEILREVLGMPYWAHAPQHKFRIGGYGNAILSRWPLADVSEIDLTLPGRKKRGALQARMKVQKGRRTRTVVLYDLHLGLTGRERASQLERFLASRPFQGHKARTPIVVAGDLNDVWGTLCARFLQPAGFERAGAMWNTFPAWLPIRPLDGIFVRGKVRSHGTQICRKPLARVASDHRPLIAELELFA